MTEYPHILRPFDRREACSVRIAAMIAGVSEQTARNWCEQHRIGRRIAGGPWRISRVALLMLLDGDEATLKAYLAGERSGDVSRYFDRAGIAQSPQTPKSLQAPQPTPV